MSFNELRQNLIFFPPLHDFEAIFAGDYLNIKVLCRTVTEGILTFAWWDI